MSLSPAGNRLPAEMVLYVLLHATGIDNAGGQLENERRREQITTVLLSCSQVSRFWAQIARSLLYKQVTLTRPRSALCFLRTLNTAPHCATLINTLIFWTSIYERPGTVGRFSTWQKINPLAESRLCNDRFLDTVALRCPNLIRLSVLNRTPPSIRVARIIALPSVAGCRPTLFSQLRSLEVDGCRTSDPDSSMLSFPQALIQGKLELPALERIMLVAPNLRDASASLRWCASTPRLHHLTVVHGCLGSTLCQSIIASPSHTLRALHLFMVTLDYGFQLPSTLKTLTLHECTYVPRILPHVLAACALSLTHLELIDTYYDLDLPGASLPPWPRFERLSSLKLGWEAMEPWGVSLLRQVLPGLSALEVTRIWTPEQSVSAEVDANLSQRSSVVLDTLSSHAAALKSLTLRGNPFMGAHQLSATLHSITQLRSLRIGTDIPGLLSEVLLQLPSSIRQLELYLEGLGAELVVEGIFMERNRRRLVPSGSGSARDIDRLETIRVISVVQTGRRLRATELPDPMKSSRRADFLGSACVVTERNEPEFMSSLTPLNWLNASIPGEWKRVPWHTDIQDRWGRFNLEALYSVNLLGNNRFSTMKGRLGTFVLVVLFLLQFLFATLALCLIVVVNLAALPVWFMVVRPCSLVFVRILK